jgi:cellulose synthase/poly-beta-1,6-N-acetylglucosamine synthase-like glycosyltransferase
VDHDQSELLPSICFIIPGWNEGSNIRRCIESIRAQTYPQLDVVMVLGGDSDPFVDWACDLSWCRLRILPQDEPNKLKACNLAVKTSGLGDILLFSDADCVYPADLAAKYAEIFRDPEKNVVTGRIHPLPRDGNTLERYERAALDRIAPAAPGPIKGIVGANFGIRRDFFVSRLEAFDETVLVGTDHAIAQQLKKAGEPIHFDPELLVYTELNASSPIDYLRQRARWTRIRFRGSSSRHRRLVRSLELLVPWLFWLLLPGAYISALMSARNGIHPLTHFAVAAWLLICIHATRRRVEILRGGTDRERDRAGWQTDWLGAFRILLLQQAALMLAGWQLITKRGELERKPDT